MLKNRQEGLLALHGTWVTIIVTLVFAGYTRLLENSGWIKSVDVNDFLSFILAIFGGTLVTIRAYQPWASRLPKLNWIQAAQVTKQQMIRLSLVVLVLAFTFFAGGDNDTRFLLASFLCIAGVIVFFANRFLPRLLCRTFFRTGTMPTILVGSPRALARLARWIRTNEALGIEIVGYLCNDSETAAAADCPIRFIGTVSQLDRVLERTNAGQLIVMQNYLSRVQNERAHAIAREAGCRIHIFNDWAQEYSHPIVVDHAGEYTFFTLDDEPLQNSFNRFIKRAFDLAIAIPAVTFLLPPAAFAVWFAQRRQSPGPLFFAEPRTSMARRPFRMLRFRTMIVRRDDDGITESDEVSYAFGRFLRRSHFDLLPQFINVLLGDMSVAGPRPHLLMQDAELGRILKSYHTRHTVKPGVMGLAQCNGCADDSLEPAVLEKRVRLDILYLNTWSILLDLQIVLQTIKQSVFPRRTGV